VPALVLVPLLAFDADGHRLGYGGGFYDRTLDGLRTSGSVLAIGVAMPGKKWRNCPARATIMHSTVLSRRMVCAAFSAEYVARWQSSRVPNLGWPKTYISSIFGLC